MDNYSLYYPDVFYFRTTFKDKDLNLKVNYENTCESTNKNVKGNLLQSIMLYDSVYIHAWELPVVIHFFNGRNNAEYVAENGLIRTINGEDKFIGCQQNGVLYTLAGGEFRKGTFSNANDINYLLQSFRGNYSDYKDISEMLYRSSVNLKTDDFFKKVEKEIIGDISDKTFIEKHRLTTKKLRYIYPQDVSFFNNHLETYKRIYYAQALNAKNIFAEDVLVDTIKEKISSSTNQMGINVDINEEFSKLTKVLKIPDIVEAVENGLITPKDILEMREKKNCVEFRKWLHSHAYITLSEKDNNDVISAYIDTFKEKGLLEKLPSKIVRFVTTSAVGMISGIDPSVGIGISAIDSFLLDKFRIGQWKPDFFLNDYKKLLKKGEKNNKSHLKP
ncbi:hypothetical protein N4T77_19980 [Clostridium sp. CX1]|uniref:hypothetical protein n=1 Tax=Clostridium sp. CX1 TaxID=2978346 RepID=UPI0021BF7984|nr:hypothetical protein [Clostridium sp. CX1]MCT8978860.1 hypothetical protein [Clostridium sp. CX1]